jgi:hypothetical protein
MKLFHFTLIGFTPHFDDGRSDRNPGLSPRT